MEQEQQPAADVQREEAFRKYLSDHNVIGNGSLLDSIFDAGWRARTAEVKRLELKLASAQGAMHDAVTFCGDSPPSTNQAISRLESALHFIEGTKPVDYSK